MSKIKIVNGYKEYIKNKEKIEVLKNINFKFELGKLYGITGASGSGKTTLLNIIGTIDKFSKCTLFIDEIDISSLSDSQKANLRMKNIGFIFQSFYLNKNLTIEENIMQPMYINENYNKIKRKKRTEELINLMGLDKRKKHLPKELSGGEQQRVAIARALANKPQIILADEPTGNLDKKNQENIFEILKQLSKNNKCVIIVSHSEKIKNYADIMLNLEEGILKTNEI